MKEHLEQVDADIIGLSQIECISGEHSSNAIKMFHFFKELGYGYQYYERANSVSASAIFYKSDSFHLLESHTQRF